MTLEELNLHMDLVKQLQGARELLAEAQARTLSAAQYDGMPHSHEASRRTENLSVFIESRQADVDRMERAVKNSEKEIREFVDNIKDIQLKSIFDLRYLCGMTWEDVACFLGGYNNADNIRMRVYRYLGKSASE